MSDEEKRRLYDQGASPSVSASTTEFKKKWAEQHEQNRKDIEILDQSIAGKEKALALMKIVKPVSKEIADNKVAIKWGNIPKPLSICTDLNIYCIWLKELLDWKGIQNKEVIEQWDKMIDNLIKYPPQDAIKNQASTKLLEDKEIKDLFAKKLQLLVDPEVKALFEDYDKTVTCVSKNHELSCQCCLSKSLCRDGYKRCLEN